VPRFRGVLHAAAFFVAIPAGVWLILEAGGGLRTAAGAIYVLTLLLGLGTSAAYHLLAKTPSVKQFMQRMDHAAIYLLIAGTYVPVSLVALPPKWGIPLLVFVGGGALVGVVIKLAQIGGENWLGYALYPVLGWAALGVWPVLGSSLSPAAFFLIVAGGVAYTLGFPVLLLKRPDPWPRMFGYHEVWHVFTVVAAVLHFGAVIAILDSTA